MNAGSLGRYAKLDGCGSTDSLDSNPIGKPLEVLAIVREQCRNAMSKHGGDDVGIVDLFAADGDVVHQLHQLVGHGVGIVGDFEVVLE